RHRSGLTACQIHDPVPARWGYRLPRELLRPVGLAGRQPVGDIRLQQALRPVCLLRLHRRDGLEDYLTVRARRRLRAPKIARLARLTYRSDNFIGVDSLTLRPRGEQIAR